MVKSEAENDMIAEFLRTSIGGSSLCGDEELAWCFVTCGSGIGKRGHQHMRSSKSFLAGSKSKVWP
jgi:hypothetical protein